MSDTISFSEPEVLKKINSRKIMEGRKRMSKLIFSDGGLYHRPSRPHVFDPGLRAAAHYLKIVDEIDPKVRTELFADVQDGCYFPAYFIGWQGIRLTPNELSLEGIPGLAPALVEREFDQAQSFFHEFHGWLNRYSMWSPFVLDLLYRILQLRDEFKRDFAYLQMKLKEYQSETATLTESQKNILKELQESEGLLAREQEGWGWWVDFLSSDITIPQLDAWFLNRIAENESHRQLFERMDRLRVDITWEPAVSAAPFRLALEGYRPEVETWDAVESRLRNAFEHTLRDYRRASQESLKTGQLNPRPKDSEKVRWGEPHRWEAAPTKYGDEHFRWLARRQIEGLRPKEIADRHTGGKAVSTVNEAIEGTAHLLQLDLRPVRRGPPSVLGD